MRKAEFLQELKEALQGEVSAAIIQENVNYYDSYISQQASSGRREEDVIEEIGSPRLIAKTIIDSHEAAGTAGGGYSSSGNYGSGGSYSSGGSAGGGSYNNGSGDYYSGGSYGQEDGPKIHYIDFNKWYWKLLSVILIIVVFLLVFAVMSGLLTVVGSILFLVMRFAGPLLMIWLIYTLFRGMRR